ncbi:MAG TPA: tetratricopeptide repeat protein [Pyrinomonadaceae bacterium]|jgi:tetratricopeptide (TPR) repeat protein
MKLRRITFKIFMICALFAVFGGNAAAQAGDQWLRVQSKNFQLVGNADEPSLHRVATRLEQFRHVFAQLFPQLKFNSPIPTRVVVFKDKQTFDRFNPVEWATGFFQAGEDINYIALPAVAAESENFSTIFHEYTHFLIDNSLGRSKAPPWFNEGIAEYYEQFAIENDQQVTLGGVNAGHLQLLQRTPLIPFETFFATDYYTLHKQSKQNAQLFYAQSWAVVHYLLQGGNAKRAAFDKFVDLLQHGAAPSDALQQAFGMNSAALETEIKQYAAQKTHAATVIQLKEKLIFDRQFETHPVAAAEAKAVQGDLLFHTRRFEDAERILLEGLTLDADSSDVNAALGLVKMQQKKYGEAKNYLEKATRNDSQNYLAYYNYALAVSRENMTEYGFASSYGLGDAMKARASLRKAIELNPNYAESYNLYAFINIIRNEELDESIAFIKKALAIAPGNQWYQIRLAELHMRREEFAAARAIAQKIMQTASTDKLKLYAENSVRTINSLEAQLEYIKNYKKRENPEWVTDEPMSDEEIARRRARQMLESLNETLRIPRQDEKRLLGYVTKIECQPNQVVFSVKADEQLLQLRSDSLETLTLISFDANVVNSDFGCGTLKKDVLSVITYRPRAGERATTAGEIVAVEFVPKFFRFLGGK